MHTGNPSIWEAEAGRLPPGQPGVHKGIPELQRGLCLRIQNTLRGSLPLPRSDFEPTGVVGSLDSPSLTLSRSP